MATIGDVARRAGVSRSTVSYALSGNRPISNETRDRIAAAIRDLGYTANAGARALATSKTWIMGLIVPFTPEEFAPATLQYVLSASETARSLGYDVLMVNRQEGDSGITRITESGLVDGVIVLDVRRRDDRIEALERAQQPSVLVGLTDDVVPIDSVDLDFQEAGRTLVRHLYRQGHRSIFFLTLPEQVFTLDLGYAWRFREAVLDLAAELGMRVQLISGDADPQIRGRSIGAALDAGTDATAMLVHNDGALTDLPLLFRERGLSIPRDLSVVSLFPQRFGQMFSLPYTAIETSAAAVTARAVTLLAARIENAEREPVRELFSPQIIDRGSSRTL